MYHKKNVVMFLAVFVIIFISLNELLAIPLIERQILITKQDCRANKEARPIKISVQTVTEDEVVYRDILNDVTGTPANPTIVPTLTPDDQHGKIGTVEVYAEYAMSCGSTSKDLLIISGGYIRASPWRKTMESIFQIIDVAYLITPEQIRVNIVIL